MDKRIDRIESKLTQLQLQAIESGRRAKNENERMQWQAKALAFQVACAVVRNRKDPNWIDD